MATLEDIQKLMHEIMGRLDDLALIRISPKQIGTTSLAEISNNLGVVTAGEFRTGNGADPGKGFSGVRIAYPAMPYNNADWHIAGINNDVLQVGINALDGKFYAGGGNVILGSLGIELANANSAFFKIHGTGAETVNIGVNASNFYFIQNDVAGGGLISYIVLSGESSPVTYLKFFTDPEDNKRTLLSITGGSQGAKMSVGRSWLVGSTGGAATEYDYLHMQTSTLTPPDPYGGQTEAHIYLRNNKVIFQFNQGGTVRYKYLDLTGTGVTWVHTTTPP